MAIVKKGKAIETRYEKIGPVCRVIQRIFKLLAYVSAVLAALLAIIAIVFLPVRVETEQLLTPHMKSITDGDGTEMYSIRLGNGMRVIRSHEDIDKSKIKSVVYARLFTLMAGLAVSVPVFHFLGKLCENVGKGKVLAPENAAFVNYIGLSVMIGNPIVLLLKRYFNYSLVKKFTDTGIHFDFGIDPFGFFLGILLIVIGTVYGYACSQHKKETALVPAEKNS